MMRPRSGKIGRGMPIRERRLPGRRTRLRVLLLRVLRVLRGRNSAFSAAQPPRIPHATFVASAMIVSMGFTPIGVGKRLASAT